MTSPSPKSRTKPRERHEGWNVLGQNPPQGWNRVPLQPGGKHVDKLRWNARYCKLGGCSICWAGDIEGCRRANGEKFIPSRYSRSPSPRRTTPRKKQTHSGPHSPSLNPRSYRQYLPGQVGGLDDVSSPITGRLYYPNSPLVTNVITEEGISEQPVASDPDRIDKLTSYLESERKRLHHTALDFYRATGQAPIAPSSSPRQAAARLKAHDVLRGESYSPFRHEGPVAPIKTSLTPSVHLSHSPRAAALPSDVFYPTGLFHTMSDITWYSEGYEMAEKSGRLVEAFYGKRKKGKVISLTLMGQKCSIDFDKMQMTKDGEKKKYKLKRSDGSDSESEEESSSSSSTEEEATWEYKHTKKGWQPLKTGFQLALEKAYTGSKGSKSFDKKIGKETLTFDLKNMTKKDKSTGEKTKIRRVCDDESNSDSEPTPKKTKSKNTKKSSKYESESSEDDSPAPSKSKKEKEKAAAKKKSKRTEESDSDDEERTKSAKVTIKPKSVKSFGKKNLIKKGRGVVEPLSGKQADCHIYESGDDVFQCMLNQSNVHANNNKFYQIQLIESDSGGNWWVFTRWGRNGTPGSTGIKPFGTIAAAEKEFKTKFRAKTLNQWDSRDDFVKRPNQYQLMDITHGSDADSDSDAASENDTPCKLEPALKSVIELISDKKVMLQTMKQFEINTDELPLGMISKKQIKSAFQHLKHIDQELRKKNPSRKVLADESCGFYTLIPHVVGMKQLPIIRSDEMVQEKMTMLDALADIEVAGKILKDSKKSKQHPLDAAYEALHCQLNRITKDHGDFKLIKDYIANTHGPTHRTFSLDVEEVFAVDREGESERFTEEISNKTLLFHGSRNSNWMGILGQGLRIAPPEAPVTGYMFGKGVYFADCSSKSANYCKTSRKDNIGFMTLNEVALGKTHDLTAAKYIEKLPKGCQSTKGCGSHEPSTTMTCDNGINWPLGKLQESKYEDDTNLLYNEYVVYDVSQIRTKYLVKLKFNY